MSCITMPKSFSALRHFLAQDSPHLPVHALRPKPALSERKPDVPSVAEERPDVLSRPWAGASFAGPAGEESNHEPAVFQQGRSTGIVSQATPLVQPRRDQPRGVGVAVAVEPL